MRGDLDGHARRRVHRVGRPVEGRRPLADVGPSDLADADCAPAGDHDDARFRPLGLQLEPATARDAERVEADVAPARRLRGRRHDPILAGHEQRAHR